MYKVFLKQVAFVALPFALFACTHTPNYKPTLARCLQCGDNTYFERVNQKSDLLAAKREFDEGYYKRAKMLLLPLACDGNPEAQYAMGYMYYYGYGVAQDTDVGYFWIKRSADQKFPPAMKALYLIQTHQDANYLGSRKPQINPQL